MVNGDVVVVGLGWMVFVRPIYVYSLLNFSLAYNPFSLDTSVHTPIRIYYTGDHFGGILANIQKFGPDLKELFNPLAINNDIILPMIKYYEVISLLLTFILNF